MNYHEHYRVWFHTYRPECGDYMRAVDIPKVATCAVFAPRDKPSVRGLRENTQLRELCALNVNQNLLEEISYLHNLEYLEMSKKVTTKDLGLLSNLQNLRILKIDSPWKIVDFSPILELPHLERLFIQNAKRMTDIEWLRPLKSRIKVLGIEGSMWTDQRIPSLSPLEGFDLEALFLASTKLEDKSLAPLKTMTNLKYLGTALNVPRTEFKELERALPHLECDWFYDSAWVGFRES